MNTRQCAKLLLWGCSGLDVSWKSYLSKVLNFSVLDCSPLSITTVFRMPWSANIELICLTTVVTVVFSSCVTASGKFSTVGHYNQVATSFQFEQGNSYFIPCPRRSKLLIQIFFLSTSDMFLTGFLTISSKLVFIWSQKTALGLLFDSFFQSVSFPICILFY